MKSIFLSISTLVASLLTFTSLQADTLNITSQPTIGNPNAKVQVVALLEPKCPDSRRYNLASFPKLKSEFIDTNKISYTVITTSFLKQSMPAAIALLCVYDPDSSNPNTDLFFKYLDFIYLVQPPENMNWATTDTLLKYAAVSSPSIDQRKLQSCIENKHYESQVEKNTAYGNKLMGELHTPTIYVNGVKIENKEDTIDYNNLKTAIDQALHK
jgi:protein-disulfide isomerase